MDDNLDRVKGECVRAFKEVSLVFSSNPDSEKTKLMLAQMIRSEINSLELMDAYLLIKIAMRVPSSRVCDEFDCSDFIGEEKPGIVDVTGCDGRRRNKSGSYNRISRIDFYHQKKL